MDWDWGLAHYIFLKLPLSRITSLDGLDFAIWTHLTQNILFVWQNGYLSCHSCCLFPSHIPMSFPENAPAWVFILGGKFRISHVSTVCFLSAGKWFLLDFCWQLCYSKIGFTSDRAGDVIKNPTWTLSGNTTALEAVRRSVWLCVCVKPRECISRWGVYRKKISFHLDSILSFGPGYFNAVIYLKTKSHT